MKNIFYYLELSFRFFKYKRRFQRKQKALGFIPDIRSTEETLDKILQDHCSVSRYGDGELNLLREKGNGFCSYNSFLSERLQEVLMAEIPDHIVCLPHALVVQDNLNLRTRVFWLAYFTKAMMSLSATSNLIECIMMLRLRVFTSRTRIKVCVKDIWKISNVYG